MTPKKENYFIILCSVLSMVFLIYIGSSLGQRAKVDITEEGLYTLSDGTKSILKKMNIPMKMRLYYSKTAANKGTEGIRAFNNYFRYVNDLLEEFTAHSRNNLTLEVIDPRPDTKEEEDALAAGLKKFHLTETEKYFFGLVVRSETGTEKVIEFFDPNRQENLEYDIAKLVYSVTNPAKKKVGILSSLDVYNSEMSPYMAQLMRLQGKDPQDSWLITKAMSELFEIKKIESNKHEITGVDILMIIHPKNLSQQTLFGIDQFILKGGKAIVFVDPFAVSDREGMAAAGPMGGAPQNHSNLKMLMDRWGVELKEGEFAGDKSLAGVGRLSPTMPPSRLLPLVQCNQSCVKRHKDSISASLQNAVFLYPGALVEKKLEGVTVTPVVSTSEKGNSYRAGPYQLNNPTMLWESFKEGQGAHLAMKSVGKFKTAFPNGIEIEEETGEGKNKKKTKKKISGLQESKVDSAVIIFSDVDFIADQFAFKTSLFGTAMANQNAILALNSLEVLTGNKDLLSVRSKGRFNRGFDVIDDIEQKAEQNTADKVNQINASIQKFQQELNQLGRAANQDNIALIQNEGIRKKKELNKQIALLKGELREVKREGREKIEKIGKWFQYLNTLLVPFLLSLIGLYFFYQKRQQQLKA